MNLTEIQIHLSNFSFQPTIYCTIYTHPSGNKIYYLYTIKINEHPFFITCNVAWNFNKEIQIKYSGWSLFKILISVCICFSRKCMSRQRNLLQNHTLNALVIHCNVCGPNFDWKNMVLIKRKWFINVKSALILDSSAVKLHPVSYNISPFLTKLLIQCTICISLKFLSQICNNEMLWCDWRFDCNSSMIMCAVVCTNLKHFSD